MFTMLTKVAVQAVKLCMKSGEFSETQLFRQRRFFGLPAAGEICPDVFFESYIFAVWRNESLPGTRGGNSPGTDGL